MMQKLTGQKAEVSVKARSVREMIDALDRKFPGAKVMLLGADGAIHHHFIIAINDEDARYLDGLDSALSGNDRVEIVASIAGGSAYGFNNFSTT